MARWLPWIALTWLGLACFGCGGDGESNEAFGAADYVAQGKARLTDNDGVGAAESFDAALALEPLNVEARFGLVLAAPMQATNVVDQILGTINSLSFAYEIGDDPAPDNPIHDYLRDKLADPLAQAETLYRELATEPELAMWLDEYPISIDNEALFLFTGRFDRTDLEFGGMRVALSTALVDFLLAHNLDFDFKVLRLPDLGGGADTFATIDAIIDLLEALLTSEDYPDFLYVEPDGRAHLQQVGLACGDFCARFGQLFAQLGQETGEQSDQALAYRDVNGDGRYTPSLDPVEFGETRTMPPATAVAVAALADKLAASFYEGTARDQNPGEVDAVTPADFADLLRSLGVLPLTLGEVVIDDLPAWPAIAPGPFFADPAPDGLRTVAEFIVTFWNHPGDLFDGDW